MNRQISVSLALFALAIPLSQAAADESQLGPNILTLEIQNQINPSGLSIKNVSASKVAARRDLVVFGDKPKFTVAAKAYCKPGSKLAGLQVILGKVVISNNAAVPFAVMGKSAMQNQVIGHGGVKIDIAADLNVTRRAGKALADFTFNPARVFETMLDKYVAKGHTAAQFLHETQAFDMKVPVSLVASCRFDPNADSLLAGKTYAGVVTREVPVTILYNGDPSIIDGPAPRAKATTRKAAGGPPAHNN